MHVAASLHLARLDAAALQSALPVHLLAVVLRLLMLDSALAMVVSGSWRVATSVGIAAIYAARSSYAVVWEWQCVCLTAAFIGMAKATWQWHCR